MNIIQFPARGVLREPKPAVYQVDGYRPIIWPTPGCDLTAPAVQFARRIAIKTIGAGATVTSCRVGQVGDNGRTTRFHAFACRKATDSRAVAGRMLSFTMTVAPFADVSLRHLVAADEAG